MNNEETIDINKLLWNIAVSFSEEYKAVRRAEDPQGATKIGHVLHGSQ